jgi:hypothetical protein
MTNNTTRSEKRRIFDITFVRKRTKKSENKRKSCFGALLQAGLTDRDSKFIDRPLIKLSTLHLIAASYSDIVREQQTIQSTARSKPTPSLNERLHELLRISH